MSYLHSDLDHIKHEVLHLINKQLHVCGVFQPFYNYKNIYL